MNAVRKTIRKLSFILLFFSCFAISQAQSPYTHGIGATVGNMFGVSYKTFLSDHFSLQADLSVRICPTAYADEDFEDWFDTRSMTVTLFSLDFNPNFLYESNITNSLYWFVGGGVTLGYCFGSKYFIMGYDDWGRFGLNAIGGLEYKFNMPIALQLDFRPGYGMLFFGKDDYWYGSNNKPFHYFDWGLGATVRYTF